MNNIDMIVNIFSKRVICMALNELINSSRDIFEALYDGVAIVDKNGVIIYVNNSNYRITGLRKEDLLRKNVKKMIPFSHVPMVLETESKIIGVETEVNSKKVISNIVPIFIEGVMEGVISIFRDVSEVLLLSKKLEEANSTIETLFKRLNFISDLDSNIVVGKSKAMEGVIKLSHKASQVTSTILIQGESGTGKEIIARFIHKHSDRGHRPFIALNCAAIPENLLESELFGYEEGAFTGAKKGGRPGVFELADKGTLFLDEIGDMNINLQSKLLRVLENKEVLRVGGTTYRKVDVRIMSATNKNLDGMIKNHMFREDLYYRIKVINLVLPPLRERREDIKLYIENASNKICSRMNKVLPKISARALKSLMEYDYPGNVRELENIIEMAIVSDEDGTIDVEDLPLLMLEEFKAVHKGEEKGLFISFESFPTFSEIEKQVLKNAMQNYRSKSKVAELLNISRSTLYRKLEEYKLDIED